MELDIETTDPN